MNSYIPCVFPFAGDGFSLLESQAYQNQQLFSLTFLEAGAESMKPTENKMSLICRCNWQPAIAVSLVEEKNFLEALLWNAFKT